MDEMILNEIYFGKLPGLVKIEDYFLKVQQKYKKSNPYSNLSAYRELIKDPILIKLAYELVDLFGFKEVSVTFARDDTFNAYCLPFVVDDKGNAYDIYEKKHENKQLSGMVIVTNSGMRFNTRKFPVNMLVCLNLGCLFKTKLTIPEVISVLLHEIGHMFSKVLMSHGMTAKADETFADSFCSMYGYGHELVSAFSKIAIRYSDFDKMFKDVPVLNVITGISQIFKGLSYYDPNEDHPATKIRLDNIVRQMEADLKDTEGLTPGMREDLKKQITQCKQLIHDTYDSTNKDNMGIRMTKYYHREMEPGFDSAAMKEADKYAHPTKLNDMIKGRIKPKGWFKI